MLSLARFGTFAKRGVVISALGAALLYLSPAHAASFDCKAAKSAVEKMICSDGNLSKLDEELTKAYAQALVVASDREALKREQRSWVRITRNRCLDVQCLSSTYRSRISSLEKRPPSQNIAGSTEGLLGVWEVLKPQAGGPYYVIVKEGTLYLTLCKARPFHIQQVLNDEYSFVARENGKCLGYSETENLNMVKVLKTDVDIIQVKFYESLTDRNWLGTHSFSRLE